MFDRGWACRDENADDFRVVYVVGVYKVGTPIVYFELGGQVVEWSLGTIPRDEDRDGINNDADNDQNVERVGDIAVPALLGLTLLLPPTQRGSVIGMETIRDVARQHNINERLIRAIVIAHEVGHKFLGGNEAHSSFYEPDHLMWVPPRDGMEGAVNRVPHRFTSSHIARIRGEGRTTLRPIP